MTGFQLRSRDKCDFFDVPGGRDQAEALVSARANPVGVQTDKQVKSVVVTDERGAGMRPCWADIMEEEEGSTREVDSDIRVAGMLCPRLCLVFLLSPVLSPNLFSGLGCCVRLPSLVSQLVSSMYQPSYNATVASEASFRHASMHGGIYHSTGDGGVCLSRSCCIVSALARISAQSYLSRELAAKLLAPNLARALANWQFDCARCAGWC